VENRIIEISNDFIGNWKKSEPCYMPSEMQSEFKIRQSSKTSDLLEIVRKGSSPKPFNSGFRVEEPDYEGVNYLTISEVEYFEKFKKLFVSSIWKKLDEDEHGKNIASILTTYELKNDGSLVYEKYGYTTYEEKDKFTISKYSDFFPENYHCVFTNTDK